MAWSAAKFIALALTLALFAIASVLLRFWAHTKTGNKPGIDDVLIIPALICVVGMAAAMVVGAELGEMAQHQTNINGPDGPIFTKQLAVFEKVNYTLQLLAVASLGFTKCSILCFYRRVFWVYPRFLFVNNVLIVVVAVWMVSFLFAMLFQCRHPQIIWTTFEYAPIRLVECVEQVPFYFSVSTSGFMLDFVILATPVPVIYQLQMHWKIRLAAVCILLLGAVVCGAGVMQLVQFVRIGQEIATHYDDITYFTTPIFAWSMVESSLAVVGANLPLLRPLLHRIERTCSWFARLLRIAGCERTVSGSTGTRGSEVKAETEKEEVRFEREESIRSYFSFELPTGPVNRPDVPRVAVTAKPSRS